MSENRGKVLLIAEHDGEKLNAATAKSLSCARELGEVSVAVLAADGAAVAAEAATLDGVARVLQMDHAANAQAVAAKLAPQIVALAEGFSHVLMPSTTFGRDVLPRVAALLGAPQVSDIMRVEDARTFQRPVYAASFITTVRVPEGCPVIGTVRTASYQPVAERQEAAAIEQVAPPEGLPEHTRYLGLESQTSERPDLQSAARVVSGGRGVGSAENFKLIFDFAERLGAAVGASRAAVDAGYVPNDLQVGQTGKIIAPDLYFAVGISGAIQHVTGIKDARTIVAINKDAEAPIFEIADLGLVGDLFKILPELAEALEKA